MSIKIMSQVWEVADVDSYTLLTLLALADHAGDDGWCWPSIEFLKKKTRLCERTLYQAIKNLVDKGLVVKAREEKKVYYKVVFAHHAVESPAPPAKKTARYAKKTAPYAEPPHPHKGGTVIEPSVNLSTNGKRSREEKPDPRFTPFRVAFDAYFQNKNHVPAPWDGKEAANLSRWLKKNPTITPEQWDEILEHRAESPVNHATELSVWIGKAITWLTKPGSEFGGFNGPTTATQRSMDGAKQYLETLRNHEEPNRTIHSPPSRRIG